MFEPSVVVVESTNVLLETTNVPEEKMAPPLSVEEKPEMVKP